MIQKKIPMRRCVGCNTSKAKKELVRVVKNASGEISLDTVGKMPGRGAYICASLECLAKAQKRKALERAFKEQIPAEVYASLHETLAQAVQQAEATDGKT